MPQVNQRQYARLLNRIWTDTTWRGLSHHAQWLYIAALSHPTLTYAGTIDYYPKRLAALSETTTPDAIQAAAEELQAAQYLIIDHDTDEALIRSFHRNDETIKQPNLATRVARDITQIASITLITAVTNELHRLHAEQPYLTGWKTREMWQHLQHHPPTINIPQPDPDTHTDEEVNN